MTQLSEMIRAEHSISEIAQYLDALDPHARESESTSLVRSDQILLFEKAADGPPSRITDFVPASRPDLSMVIHTGRNTVQTIRYFQHFEKRFARPKRHKKKAIGYNFSNAFFITPGYFVAYETDSSGREWRSRGGVVIDYFLLPDGEVPEGWPDVIPNDEGLQRFVYHRTRDFMRRVSAHVSIGRASREDAKGDHILDYWFTLCRRDEGAST
jgi:hypothetical protein